MFFGDLRRIIVGVDTVGEHHLGVFAYHLIKYIDPLAVQIDGHQGVTIVAAAHVKSTYHHAIDAVGFIKAPAVIVTTLMGDDRVFLENIDIGAIVVQVIENGIVVDTQHPHARLDHHVECAIEPQEVFLLDVTVAHLHKRAAIHAHDYQIINREHKAVTTPQVVEGLAGTLAPVVLVVTGNDIQRMGDTVQDALDVEQLLVAALVGEVACHHHGINVGRVYLGNGFTQFALIGIAGSDMHIAQDGQSDHPTLHR